MYIVKHGDVFDRLWLYTFRHGGTTFSATGAARAAAILALTISAAWAKGLLARWLYRAVVLGSEWPKIAPISVKLRPDAAHTLARRCRRSRRGCANRPCRYLPMRCAVDSYPWQASSTTLGARRSPLL